MFLWLLLLLVPFLLCVYLMCPKAIVTRQPFERRKIVYRIVADASPREFAREQGIFTRRAQSLWGKEMANWDTFRISFPSPPTHGVFGIVVPETFDLDPDCLHELGFSLGALDSLPDAALVELPMRRLLCSNHKISRFRAGRALDLYFRSHAELDRRRPLAEFRNSKRGRVTFLRAISDGGGLWAPPQ
jgi:hypothetical protein